MIKLILVSLHLLKKIFLPLEESIIQRSQGLTLDCKYCFNGVLSLCTETIPRAATRH